jgi:hypothetical protein
VVLGSSGSYAAWVSWLEAYGRGDDLPSGHLRPVDARMGPQMLERLLSHVHKAFYQRQQRWNDALLRDLRALSPTAADPVTNIALMMTNARTRLTPLRAFAEHPAFTEELRELLRGALAETVRSSQHSLEDSTRRNSLTVPLTSPSSPPKPGPAPGRRVIL